MDFLEKSKIRNIILFTTIITILIVTFVMCIRLGSVNMTTNDVIDVIFNRGNSQNNVYYNIIWNIRFPRTLAAIIGGASLAVAGLLLQIFFKNPIVEPYVLGVSSGATLMVALIMLGGFSLGFNRISPLSIFIAALGGSVAVMIVVIIFASKVKSVVTLLVIGLMTGYICSGVTKVLTVFADKERLQGFTIWTMGSFSGFTWDQVKILMIIGVPVLFLTFFMVKPLNAFLLGEEYAKSMGLNLKFFRISIVALASILAAVVTAFSGPVGFIGLAVPQVSRLIFKSVDNRILVPGVILLGGIVTALCDLVARTALSPVELPISAITSFIGAPLVIGLLLKRRKHS